MQTKSDSRNLTNAATRSNALAILSADSSDMQPETKHPVAVSID